MENNTSRISGASTKLLQLLEKERYPCAGLCIAWAMAIIANSL